jgi:uncharacterized membrane protein
MNFELIKHAPLAIQLHLATVLPAFAIGTWQIFGSVKGSRPHRALGFIYLALMTITAVTTYFIRSVNHGSLSLIHLFIPLTLYGVIAALWFAHRGIISRHRNAMIGFISEGSSRPAHSR